MNQGLRRKLWTVLWGDDWLCSKEIFERLIFIFDVSIKPIVIFLFYILLVLFVFLNYNLVKAFLGIL